MAIIKRADTEGVLILEEDDALDKAHPDYDWLQHFETGDRRFVPIKTGCSPSVFYLRRLTRRQYEHVFAQPTEEARFREAVAYGLDRVENYGPQELKRFRTEAGERITDEHLDDLHAAGLFRVLGLRVLTFSTLNPSSAPRS